MMYDTIENYNKWSLKLYPIRKQSIMVSTNINKNIVYDYRKLFIISKN